MDTNLFNFFKEFFEKYYKETLSFTTFVAFKDYCDKGQVVDGVKTNFNPINCFAFAKGITSSEADNFWMTN